MAVVSSPDIWVCEAESPADGRKCGFVFHRTASPAEVADAAQQLAAYDKQVAKEAAQQAIIDRRARVRALVHSLLSTSLPYKGNDVVVGVVRVAEELDQLIESIGAPDAPSETLAIIQGRES